MKRALVIGYGNTLRGDDGAGIRAAERLAGRLPGVDVVTAHQLQPELAETISHYARVFFLDASAEASDIRSFVLTPAAAHIPGVSHDHSPEALLELCQNLYGRVPERTFLIAIPGQTFDLSEHLSAFTEKKIERAIEEVGRYLMS